MTGQTKGSVNVDGPWYYDVTQTKKQRGLVFMQCKTLHRKILGPQVTWDCSLKPVCFSLRPAVDAMTMKGDIRLTKDATFFRTKAHARHESPTSDGQFVRLAPSEEPILDSIPIPV